MDVESIIDDLSKMINCFVRAGMYSFADKLANATSKEVVEATLYEALRIARSALDAGRTLDESVRPYVAREDSVRALLEILDKDLERGLDIVRRVAIRALTMPSRG